MLGDALAYPSGSNLHVLPGSADFCLQGSTVASRPRGRETSGTNWSILLTPGQETELCKFTWQADIWRALRVQRRREAMGSVHRFYPWVTNYVSSVDLFYFAFFFFFPFSFQQFDTKIKMLKLEFKHPGVSNMRRRP